MTAQTAAQVAPEAVQVADDTKLHLLLFKDVENSAELRKRLVSDDNARDMSLMDASTVVSKFHVQLAAFKALEAAADGKLATRTLHSELVYCLAGSKSIGESLRRCGLHDDTKHVLVGLFDASEDDVQSITSLVQGTPVSLEQLSELHDPLLIQQAFKVTKEELESGSLEDGVVAKIAARDC